MFDGPKTVKWEFHQRRQGAQSADLFWKVVGNLASKRVLGFLVESQLNAKMAPISQKSRPAKAKMLGGIKLNPLNPRFRS